MKLPDLSKLRPTHHDVVDGAFAGGLTILALTGFQTAFGGLGYMVAGVVGVLVGLLVAHVILRLRLPGLLALAIGLLVFVLVGSVVAAGDEALFGVIPTPAALAGLIDGLVSGWRRLLTSLPPSGDLGNLLAVPYFCGFVSALIGQLVARRTKLLATLLIPSAMVLALSIMFGTREPFSLFVQGALFAVAAIAWLALRRGRERRPLLQSSGHKRLISATVMLALVGSAGLVVGPRMPFAQASDRFVLRTDPPFDPRQYGSPLNGFQKYLIGNLKDTSLFEIEGMPKSSEVQRIRLAAMDDYDGVVWRVGSGSSPGAAEFIRVGEHVPSEVHGDQTVVDVRLRGLPGIWVPTVGTVTGIRWPADSDRSKRLRDLFRLSPESNTAAVAVSGGWNPDDRYAISGVIAAPPNTGDLAQAVADSSIRVDLTRPLPDDMAAMAASITKGKAGAYEQAKALELWFRKGYYVAGDETVGAKMNPPGHSYARLEKFLTNDTPVGNAEQYAAAMALFARSLNLPARVVMGFRVQPEATEVFGRDVDAWVEIAFDGVGWVVFDPTNRENTAVPEQTKKKQRPRFESQEVPPPPIAPPTPDSPPTKEGKSKALPDPPKPERAKQPGGGSHLLLFGAVAAVPFVLISVPVLVVLLLKRRRRSRRRRHADPTRQVAGGWDEVVDRARDARLPVPLRATRRDLAVTLGSHQVAELAQTADAAIFGPGQPTPETVDQFWKGADLARRELLKPLSTWSRFRAAASVTSLRTAR